MAAGRDLADRLDAVIELSRRDPLVPVGRLRQFPKRNARLDAAEVWFHDDTVLIMDALRAAAERACRSGAVTPLPALGRVQCALTDARGPGEGYVLVFAVNVMHRAGHDARGALAQQVRGHAHAGDCARGACRQPVCCRDPTRVPWAPRRASRAASLPACGPPACARCCPPVRPAQV